MASPIHELARYEEGVFDPFVIALLDPSKIEATPDEEVLDMCVRGISLLIEESWREKFVKPGHMTRGALAQNVKSPEVQKQAIVKPSRAAQYIMAFNVVSEGVYTIPDLQAMLRVERYVPRWRPVRPYPNVTDLETCNGLLGKGTRFAFQAGALLYHGLQLPQFEESVKIAAYTETPNTDGIDFYQEIGFRARRTVPEASLPFTYVHMEAPDKLRVLQNLTDMHAFLRG